jgi:2-ketocyclohexanecarboxyl-CoA hydrolase
MHKYEDIVVETRGPVAEIRINRPDRLNALRMTITDREIIRAFDALAADAGIRAIVLTGAGERAFCTGADQSAHEGSYGGRGTIGLPIDELQSLIRDVPKPVIARVQGFAIGGGNVLATLCDLTLASEKAVFGQVGPKVGSVDPGFGTAYLARLVGEKRAREIWYLCRRYSAKEAYDMGLVNAVVPAEKLDEEVDAIASQLAASAPHALAGILDAVLIGGDGGIDAGLDYETQTFALCFSTADMREGTSAFLERRKPAFSGN